MSRNVSRIRRRVVRQSSTSGGRSRQCTEHRQYAHLLLHVVPLSVALAKGRGFDQLGVLASWKFPVAVMRTLLEHVARTNATGVDTFGGNALQSRPKKESSLSALYLTDSAHRQFLRASSTPLTCMVGPAQSHSLANSAKPRHEDQLAHLDVAVSGLVTLAR